MILILDEWIFHDLQNENGNDRQRETFQFLERIKEKNNDKIVWIKNSKFEDKYWNLSKLSSRKVELRKKFKFLENSFRFNSCKTKFLNLQHLQNISINDNIDKILKKIKADDHYLVLSYFYLRRENQKCIIVTTDEKLKNILEPEGVIIKLRNEFIKQYLKNDTGYY